MQYVYKSQKGLYEEHCLLTKGIETIKKALEDNEYKMLNKLVIRVTIDVIVSYKNKKAVIPF